MKNSKNWSKDSWRGFEIKQQPSYEDQEFLKKIEKDLSQFPPLVTIDEIEKLKSELAMVCKEEAFLLQCGDCAESFTEFSHDNLKSFFRTLMQMTATLMYGAKKPIVKVGRIAGQYAKPRSSNDEMIDGKSLPSYRGDIINAINFDEKSRISDPKRLIDAYFYSSASLNYLRSLALGGYGNLKKINKWNEEFVGNLNQNSSAKNKEIVDAINSHLDFIKACGLNISEIPQFTTANFYTSHEALLLNYEQAFIRQEKTGKYYDQSAHMLWIGDRTRNPKEAHVEFMRGISNPIAFKVGPSISKEDLLSLLEILNPENEAGRITLISRMGAKIEETLPPLLDAVKKSGKNVIWSCDPMHGNTIKSTSGYKTRKFDDILKEIKSFFKLHRKAGTYAGGIHFEMTGQDVTECLGGNQQIDDEDLGARYHTHCDPRLNSSQSIELAFLIAEEMASKK